MIHIFFVKWLSRRAGVLIYLKKADVIIELSFTEDNLTIQLDITNLIDTFLILELIKWL